MDVVTSPGWISHMEHQWEHPLLVHFRGSHVLKGVPDEWRLSAVRN